MIIREDYNEYIIVFFINYKRGIHNKDVYLFLF